MTYLFQIIGINQEFIVKKPDFRTDDELHEFLLHSWKEVYVNPHNRNTQSLENIMSLCRQQIFRDFVTIVHVGLLDS